MYMNLYRFRCKNSKRAQTFLIIVETEEKAKEILKRDNEKFISDKETVIGAAEIISKNLTI